MTYGTPHILKGLGKHEREVLARLRRDAKGVIEVKRAADLLGKPRASTARILSVLARKGWLTRVKRGVYIPVPLESASPTAYPEDSWVLASSLFAPCYIGGWSAAEHWDLTEQIFRAVFVVTTHAVRKRSKTHGGVEYRIKNCRPYKFFGFATAWRTAVRVNVSDLDKTIVDMMDDPSAGGGIRHVAEIFRTYWERSDRNLANLLDYSSRMNNGAIFKRLGYMAESLVGADREFLESCRRLLTTGNAVLDPNVKQKGRLIKCWRLWVNARIEPATE